MPRVAARRFLADDNGQLPVPRSLTRQFAMQRALDGMIMREQYVQARQAPVAPTYIPNPGTPHAPIDTIDLTADTTDYDSDVEVVYSEHSELPDSPPSSDNFDYDSSESDSDMESNDENEGPATPCYPVAINLTNETPKYESA